MQIFWATVYLSYATKMQTFVRLKSPSPMENANIITSMSAVVLRIMTVVGTYRFKLFSFIH